MAIGSSGDLLPFFRVMDGAEHAGRRGARGSQRRPFVWQDNVMKAVDLR